MDAIKFLDAYEAEQLYVFQLDPGERGMQAAYAASKAAVQSMRQFAATLPPEVATPQSIAALCQEKQGEAARRMAELAQDAARLDKFIDWYLRGGKRMEIDPHGHASQTTKGHILHWLDGGSNLDPQVREDKKGGA